MHAHNAAAPPRPEPAWTPSCPGHPKDAPAVVPPVIPARVPAPNPGYPQPAARSPQSTPRLSRHSTRRVTPACPAGTTTRSPTGYPITYDESKPVHDVTSVKEAFDVNQTIHGTVPGIPAA